MTLHDTFACNTGWSYEWYYAVNTRRGRRHLLQVPRFMPDRLKLRVPRYIRPERFESWRDSAAIWCIPARILESGLPTTHPRTALLEDPASLRRMCDTRQNAYSWHAGSAPPLIAYSICRPCFFLWSTYLNRETPNSSRRTIQTLASADNINQWIENLETRLYRQGF
jgi:hypothetical protein